MADAPHGESGSAPQGAALSSAMEDYLKTIYELGSDVKTQDIADRLGVSAASATGMIKRLAALNLLEHAPYRGVNLTDAGRLIALETVRHHRLIETYLAQALGYPWHEVHAEAERLEHTISEAFERRIAEALGDPTHDPHGDPIPRLDGTVPASLGCPLTELPDGARATVTRITDQRSEVLQYLAEHSLVPGERVTIVERAPFEGPLLVSTAGGSLALSLELARGIHAHLVSPDDGEVAP